MDDDERARYERILKDQQELQRALEDSRDRVGVATDDFRRVVGAALVRAGTSLERARAETVGNVTTFAFDPADPAFGREAGWQDTFDDLRARPRKRGERINEWRKRVFGILPSQRFRYFKVGDAKSNLAPRSGDSPWYELHSVELPNPEPPTYQFGDNVQAVARVDLLSISTAPASASDLETRREILDLVDRGKIIDGKSYPYSLNATGAKNRRASSTTPWSRWRTDSSPAVDS